MAGVVGRATRKSSQLQQQQQQTSQPRKVIPPPSSPHVLKAAKHLRPMEVEAAPVADPNISNPPDNDDTIKWTHELETTFFKICINNTPIGLNKHFRMIGIAHEMNVASGKDLPIPELWKHLSKFYDFDELRKNQENPFPEEEFSLPPEYNYLMKERQEGTSAKPPQLTPVVTSVGPGRKPKLGSLKSSKKSI